MADAPKIIPTGPNKDSLRTGTEKINAAIDNANEALGKANTAKSTADNAKSTADTALANSESTQSQLDAVVIDGDSSPQIAQALADSPYTTLRQKHDAMDAKLADKAQQSDLVATNAQISTLVANAGDGTIPSELSLIRADKDGNTFATAPDRVRNIEKILSDGKTRQAFSDWEVGGISSSGANLVNTTRLRTAGYKQYLPGTLLEVYIASGYTLNAVQYDVNKNYVSTLSLTGKTTYRVYFPFVRFVIGRSDNANLTVADNVNCYTVIDQSTFAKSYVDRIVTLGRNKFNPADMDSTGFLQNAYTITANSGYYTTGFIRYSAGDTVIVKHCRKLARYEVSGNIFVDNTDNSTYSFTATEAGHVRASFSTTYLGDMQVQVGVGITEADYEPYHYKFAIPYNVMADTSPLYQKVAYSFGDSIMYGAGNDGVGIRDLLAQKYSMTGADYAVGGATMGFSSGRSHIVEQIQSAISAGMTPDIIFINGMTNDILYSALGAISSDYDYASHGYADFASGMEYAFGLLKDNFPNVPIIYVRSHNMSSRDAAKQVSYGDLAVSICEKWGVYCVDLYKQGMNTNIASICLAYTYDTYSTGLGDGTHPNLAGYKDIYLPPIIKEAEKRLRVVV